MLGSEWDRGRDSTDKLCPRMKCQSDVSVMLKLMSETLFIIFVLFDILLELLKVLAL